MPVPLPRRRRAAAAELRTLRAALRKGAAGRQARRLRHVAGDGFEPGLQLAQIRGAAQQAPGIGVVLPAAEHLLHPAQLHDASRVHDRPAVAEARDDAQIVAYEQHRRAQLLLQAAHHVQDLRLDGDVQRRRRLVRQQQLRLGYERHGDDHALLHAARELVWVVPRARGRDADHVQHPVHPPAPLLPAHGGKVQLQHLAYLLAHRLDGVQARHRVLEYHRDAPAAQAQHIRLALLQQLVPAEDYAPARYFAHALGQQAQDGERQRRLARARLPDKAQLLAARRVEVEAVKRADVLIPAPVPDAEVLHLKQLFSGSFHARHLSVRRAGRRRPSARRR